ncbi:MAG: DUF308 domain-containing protein [Pyramidobacter sp.]|nr:DUF308 domain-containing protein [Pyramidobacter sp.]
MVILNRISLDPNDLKCSRRRFFWLGVLMILIGAISLFMPFLMSFAVETLLGVSILISGFARLWSAFGERSWQQALLAAVGVLGGCALLARPFIGMIALGTMLGVFFLITGAAKCAEYFRVRDIGGSFWVFVSGAVDVFLAFAVMKNVLSAASAPGIMLGINMLSTGVTMICLSRGCARMASIMSGQN